MDRYIEIGCDDCGKILPANMAYRRNVKVKSGSTEWNSPTYINGQKTVQHNSVAHYSHRTLSLCEPCETARRNAEKLRFWAIAIGLVVVAAVIFFNAAPPSQTADLTPAVPEAEAFVNDEAEALVGTPYQEEIDGASRSVQEVEIAQPIEQSEPIQSTGTRPYSSVHKDDPDAEKVRSVSEEPKADLDGLY